MRTCTLPGCELKYFSTGYCAKHYRALVVRGGYKKHECGVEGCSVKTVNGFCEVHQFRIARKLPLDLDIKSLKGARHYRWKGGISPYPNYSFMYRQRMVILMNDPKCEICRSAAMDVHHKDLSKSNHQLSNLQALCRSCHNQLHRRVKNNLTNQRNHGKNYSLATS